jgi:YidC/Oxa1 family membrane protein insertase
MLFGVPLDAAYHVVSALAVVFTPVLAIVVFTVLVRLLIMPLSLRALRGQAAQARIAPQVQALRERHRKQPERLQGELTRDMLGTHWLSAPGPVSLQGLAFLAVFGLLAAIGYLAARWSTPLSPNGSAPSPGTTLVSRVAPLVTVALAVFSPLATGVYLVTTMAWTVAERRVFSRWRGTPDVRQHV